MKLKPLLLLSALLAFCALPFASFAQVPAGSQKETLSGRVLAQVDFPYGAGIGPLWQQFIFGIESESEPKTIKPVLIAYLFHNFKSDPPLREQFFDHSKLYDLTVTRDKRCDKGVDTLIVTNGTETTSAILLVSGAPKDILKSDMVLPCYVFYRGNYRVK